MAKPIEFPEQNTHFGKPEGWIDCQCGGLPTWEGKTVCAEVAEDGGLYESELPAVISCWKLSAEDLEEINRTGVVWLNVCSTQMPPVSLFTENPFQPDLG